ncbi:hypothetical protein PSU4_03140 [Pseudonocardia sulfidoxydans NBRC 16205]|uniref:Uncharacterized protein n=1 Tax=Pseudonocardia sulfidoxydans NBRC 16205 TaxID=1223511 RepID=A0A511D980_9PSEU|nr:hypothetical protein [Pseudonocardia sulfidoxydans]GEL21360.1 hypothetical protein PSU4_03140 [Pseudonocardia sulfidoxydans NBRC 16205]
MTPAYWVAVALAGAGLLTMVVLALSLGLRLRRLARDAGSLRTGIAAATGPITAAMAAGRSRKGTSTP